MDYFRADEVRTTNGFYLVQRLKRNPMADLVQRLKRNPMADHAGNLFRMGAYDLDYMGSDEFEFGTIPAAYKRIVEAQEKNDLELDLSVAPQHDLMGNAPIDVLYIKSEGLPYKAMAAWADKKFEGKVRPYDFESILLDDVAEPLLVADIWWALGANVMWSLSAPSPYVDGDTSHLLRMLESLKASEPPRLRG